MWPRLTAACAHPVLTTMNAVQGRNPKIDALLTIVLIVLSKGSLFVPRLVLMMRRVFEALVWVLCANPSLKVREAPENSACHKEAAAKLESADWETIAHPMGLPIVWRDSVFPEERILSALHLVLQIPIVERVSICAVKCRVKATTVLQPFDRGKRPGVALASVLLGEGS